VPTIAPILAEVGSTLPTVRSTSLTTIPGDAKFNGILFFLAIQIYLKIFMEKGIFSGETVHEYLPIRIFPSIKYLFHLNNSLYSTFFTFIRICRW
jgi:hypothetical protein